MTVATFVPDTDWDELYTLVPAEQAQIALLRDEGRMGNLQVSAPRSTVFLEIFADDENAAADTVKTLPMSKFWTLDVFPTPEPTLPE
jgi:hypothetical protein